MGKSFLVLIRGNLKYLGCSGKLPPPVMLSQGLHLRTPEWDFSSPAGLEPVIRTVTGEAASSSTFGSRGALKVENGDHWLLPGLGSQPKGS